MTDDNNDIADEIAGIFEVLATDVAPRLAKLEAGFAAATGTGSGSAFDKLLDQITAMNQRENLRDELINRELGVLAKKISVLERAAAGGDSPVAIDDMLAQIRAKRGPGEPDKD